MIDKDQSGNWMLGLTEKIETGILGDKVIVVCKDLEECKLMKEFRTKRLECQMEYDQMILGNMEDSKEQEALSKFRSNLEVFEKTYCLLVFFFFLL